MTTEVLGKLSFSETPDVNGSEVLLNAGGVPTILSGITASRPAAGQVGRLFLDTTLNRFYRDNGSSWDDLTPAPLLDGTTNEIVVVDGTNVTPSIVSLAPNPIIPGTGAVRVPVGSTAQRPGAPAAGDTRFNSTIARNETFNGSFWIPAGAVLQVVFGPIAATTTTAQVPYDNSAPTITEGVQIWASSFTPISATSRLLIQYSMTVAQSTVARIITTSVFDGSTNVGASSVNIAIGATTQNLPHSLSVQIIYEPGSTATINFTARIGANGTGTTSVNRTTGGTLAGALVSHFTITEIA